MASRRRPQSEFDATQAGIGPQIETLDSLIGGYNGYVDPSVLSPQFWAACSNVYAGQFQTIRRARWAPIYNYGAPGSTPVASAFSYNPPTPGSAALNLPPYIIFDYTNSPTQILPYTRGLATFSPSPLFYELNVQFGPYMRFSPVPAFIMQANGTVRSKLFANLTANPIAVAIEFWGIDAPDSSVQVTLNAGSTATITTAVRTSNVVLVTLSGTRPANLKIGAYVNIAGVADTTFNTAAGVAAQVIAVPGTTQFTYANVGSNASSTGGTATVQITKTVGRSYSWAWENASTGHVSAPSPASQYVKYTNQTGTIDCIQPGTISVALGNVLVSGTDTQFSPAWVGRRLWIEGLGSTDVYDIAGVQSPTLLTLAEPASFNGASQRFQVVDFQSTDIRLYATGDAASVYFRVARNAFFYNNPTLGSAGLEFVDTANSEPPNQPFTSEIAQAFNVPPPIGQFLQDYQGRILVYGVAGAEQSFFYSNIETTLVGQPPESFAPLNQVTLPIGDGSLNGMANLPTGLIIWSDRQDMFKLTGLLTDNSVANQYQLAATIQRLPYRIGCASAYATTVTSLGCFWLSSDREVWLFTDHYAPKNVGKPIQDILNRINGDRIGFARMTNYKAGDRNWLVMAVALDSSETNNKLCLLDLDLLASNGQASYFTFDMATNQPTWYLYDIDCESILSAVDTNSVQHLVVGNSIGLTDADWHPGYYTVSAEVNVVANVTLHALGNENPEVVKTMNWLRAMTNQLPSQYITQVWSFAVLTYDDDKTVLGNPGNTGNVVNLVPGTQNPTGVRNLEYSPAVFRLGSTRFVKGRRFQIQANFPTVPGLWELRGFQVHYTNTVAR